MVHVSRIDDFSSQYLGKYQYTISLRRRDWAWEFLRRNPEFISQAYSVLEHVEQRPSCIPGGQVYRLSAQQSVADHWGLLFCPNPDIAAPKAGVFWVPENDPCVVPMMVSARNIHEKDEMFAEVMESCTIDVLQDAFGNEHLLTRNKYSSAQSLCFGLSVLSGESVKLSLHPQNPDDVDRAYRAYRRAKTVLHAEPWNWSERKRRLRNALICLDVKQAGLPLRDAGEIIFGAERIQEEWAHNKSLRDRVRSFHRAGLRLRDGGYLGLLKSAPIDPAGLGS